MTALPAPFLVRAYPVNTSMPPLEEPVVRFGPALDRAIQMASALSYRSAEVIDRNGTLLAQLNLLWSVPRELR